MTEDATLSDFLSDPEGDDSEETHSSGEDPDTTVSEPGTTAIDPLAPVYGVGTYTCDHCGESTDRVWRRAADFVCPACTSW